MILLNILTEEQQSFVEQLFREHHARFQRISFKILQSESAANDAVSTAYLKIMDNIEKISQLPCPQMIAFCVTIVKNTSIDLIRQSKKLAHTEYLDQFIDESTEHFEDSYIKKADIQRLAELINQLSPEEKVLIQLRYVQDMGYAQIGTLLGISEDTAKKRGQRVTQKLRKLYEKG
jgi:RNA polymerase sigma-70 factor (ECF subfamily)